MNTKKAIKIIRDQYGYFIEKIGKDKYRVSESKFPNPACDEFYSGRELINLAREYTSEKQNTKIKSTLKWADKRVNRSETKTRLYKQDYDHFSFNRKAKQDNIWNWD
jgi:hypothetical protein